MSIDKRFVYSRKKSKAIPYFSASSVGDTKTLYEFGIKEILVSYFYIRKALKFYEEWLPKFKAEGGIFMTDSGAFSFMGSAYTDEMETPEFWDDYRKEYIDWCVAHKDCIFSMVNLDLDKIVGHDPVYEWNRKYFEPLEKMGIQVIYVSHEVEGIGDDDGTKAFTYYCKRYRYVGVNQVLKKYAQKFYNISNHYKCRVHGFAWTDLKILKRYPFFSVDSSVGYNSYVWIKHNDIIEHIKIGDLFNSLSEEEVFGIEERRHTYMYDTLTLCKDNKIRWRPLTSIVAHKVKKKMYRINLEGGNSVDVTCDHSLIKLNKDGGHISVKAEELSVGDTLLLMANSEKFLPEETSCLPYDLLLYIGLWIGDGSRVGYDINLSGCNNLEVRQIAQNVASMFGAKLTISSNDIDTSISSKGLRECFNRFDLVQGRPKRITKEMLSLPINDLLVILRGYFSADGTATDRSVEFSTVSEELKDTLCSLLHSFGIHTSVSTNNEHNFRLRGKIYKARKCYHVTINDAESRAIFMDKIDFCTSEKHNRLYMGLLKDKCKNQTWAKRSGVDVRLSKTGNITMSSRNYGLGALKKTQLRVNRESNGSNFNTYVLDNDIWYYKVNSITPIESEDRVFDLEVPDTQNFLANDIVVHNTSWLTGIRFGTTFIDDGKNFRSIDSKHKYLRKTHKRKYESEGISIEGIKADERDAIQNMNLIGWRAFVREYIKVADMKLWNKEVCYYE